MRKPTPDELKDLKPKRITKEEWLALSPTYCLVCRKFIQHWWDAWDNPQPSFSADITIGGWYCSSHTSEELKSAQQSMHLTAFGVVLRRQPAKILVFLHRLLARIGGR
jgi:hypothetical protein